VGRPHLSALEGLVQLDCPPGDGVSCEVLALIAEGRSNAGIARLMGISEKSVVAHTPGI